MMHNIDQKVEMITQSKYTPHYLQQDDLSF